MEAPGRRKGSCTDLNEKTENAREQMSGVPSHAGLSEREGNLVFYSEAQQSSHRGPEQPAVPERVTLALPASSGPTSRSPVT